CTWSTSGVAHQIHGHSTIFTLLVLHARQRDPRPDRDRESTIGNDGTRMHVMTNYLVTGATGLIGRHFMREVLADPETERVWVTVRPGSRDKLDRMARDWPNRDRLTPVIGDVSEERLGLSEDVVQQLRGRVDHLVHLAALYDIEADDEANERINIAGTANTIALAAEIRAGCLHQVSSVAVAGDFA